MFLSALEITKVSIFINNYMDQLKRLLKSVERSHILNLATIFGCSILGSDGEELIHSLTQSINPELHSLAKVPC